MPVPIQKSQPIAYRYRSISYSEVNSYALLLQAANPSDSHVTHCLLEFKHLERYKYGL